MWILWLFLLFLFWHRELLFLRPMRRKNVYNQAKQRADKLQKPLLVVGDPASGGWVTRLIPFSYGCGDICVDIQGCDACADSIQADIENVLPRLPSNSCVVFISVVLEYVENIEQVIGQLNRVAGKNLFVVHIKNQPYGASYSDKAAYFVQKYNILGAPPEEDDIRFKRMS